MSNENEPDYRELITRPRHPSLLRKIVLRAKTIMNIENWQKFVGKRGSIDRGSSHIAMVKLRNGVHILIRPGTHDLFIVYEMFVEGGYRQLEKILRTHHTPVTVIDLGAHIGCFTVRASRACNHVHVHSYEPSDDNREVLKRNVELSAGYKKNITIFADAATGNDATAIFYHNPNVTTDSSVYGHGDGKFVPSVSLKTVLSRCNHPIGLLKIDIEGAEYELLENSDSTVWREIPVVMAELHPDPRGLSDETKWLQTMFKMGYTKQFSDLNGVLLQRGLASS